MSKRRMKKRETTVNTKDPTLALWLGGGDINVSGYTRLDQNPEVLAAMRKIAELIASCTIHLMNNTADGDVRITNELSRLVDINPMPNMTRSTWMEGIVENMLVRGRGNAVVVPHTYQGYIQSLEPIAASRVQFLPDPGSYRDYKVLIDGQARDPSNLLHFVYNPDETFLWRGCGVTAALKDIVTNLRQATRTEKAFMASEYKPSIIVKVDTLVDEFSSPEGRQKLIDSYVKPSTPGEPWIIPAEQFSVEQVKPLTLSDLAISDTVQLDKRTVAALFGVPPYVVGVGEYKRDEYNAFIQGKIMTLAKAISQELTKKLLINPAWYWRLNVWSLIDYDLQTTSNVLLAGADRGFVCGDEWRDRLHLAPAGLKEFKVLENYIPYDLSGNQKKLVPGDS